MMHWFFFVVTGMFAGRPLDRLLVIMVFLPYDLYQVCHAAGDGYVTHGSALRPQNTQVKQS
jgi:hypothetical protein